VIAVLVVGWSQLGVHADRVLVVSEETSGSWAPTWSAAVAYALLHRTPISIVSRLPRCLHPNLGGEAYLLSATAPD